MYYYLTKLDLPDYNDIGMPTKTSPTRSKKVSTPESTEKKNEYVELKLPKIPFDKKYLTPLLVLLLIVGAYFLGVQTTKVSFLEEQAKNQTSSTTDTNSLSPSPAPVVATVGNGHLPILGNKNAPVTIVEFSDFQCPFCKRFTDDTFAELKKEYIDTGKVKYAFRHYPLPIHPNAPKAAEASECANEQGTFWKYHDLLFENQGAWSNLTQADAQQSFISYAGNLGLNTTQFEGCLNTDKYQDKVAEDTKAAEDAQVSATPTFYINGQQLVGALPLNAFKTIIDEQLK